MTFTGVTDWSGRTVARAEHLRLQDLHTRGPCDGCKPREPEQAHPIVDDEYVPMQPCVIRPGWTCVPMWSQHQECTEANRAGLFKPDWMP